MKKSIIIFSLFMGIQTLAAQEVLTSETLWKLGRVSPLGISKDGKNILFKVSIPSVEENKSNSKTYSIPVNGGAATEITDTKELLVDKNLSPDGKYKLSHKEVKVEKINGKDVSDLQRTSERPEGFHGRNDARQASGTHG